MKKGKDQWEIDNFTIRHHKLKPSPAGDHKASINRRARKHNNNKTDSTQMIHKRSATLERSVKYFTGGLKPVSRRTNLTLNSDRCGSRHMDVLFA